MTKSDKPKCPICNKRVIHRTIKSTCYNCFSDLVKQDKWSTWVLSNHKLEVIGL